MGATMSKDSFVSTCMNVFFSSLATTAATAGGRQLIVDVLVAVWEQDWVHAASGLKAAFAALGATFVANPWVLLGFYLLGCVICGVVRFAQDFNPTVFLGTH